MHDNRIRTSWILNPHLKGDSKVNKKNFWDNVDKPDGDGCWLWTGGKARDGYGRFAGERVHRLAWMTTHKQWVPDGMHVLHLCDQPNCVRPDHLMLGDHAENMRQKAERGRGNKLRGEDVGQSKLTWTQVRSIRAEYAAGISQAKLGRKYGVGQTAISQIVRFKTWVESNADECTVGTSKQYKCIECSGRLRREQDRDEKINGICVSDPVFVCKRCENVYGSIYYKDGQWFPNAIPDFDFAEN